VESILQVQSQQCQFHAILLCERSLERSEDGKVGNKMIPFPDKKYKTIVVDPPWPVGILSLQVRPLQKEMPYNTMNLDEIKSLPIQDLAEESCHIYLWTTHKFLPCAFDVLKVWGFKYNCLLTWDKTDGFCPFGFKWTTEFCLFATRNQRFKKIEIKTLFKENHTVHSRKPQTFFNIVEKVSYPPYLEMFARKPRHGWDTWGDEIENLKPLEAFS